MDGARVLYLQQVTVCTHWFAGCATVPYCNLRTPRGSNKKYCKLYYNNPFNLTKNTFFQPTTVALSLSLSLERRIYIRVLCRLAGKRMIDSSS